MVTWLLETFYLAKSKAWVASKSMALTCCNLSSNLIKLADFGTCHRLPAGKKVITLDEPPKARPSPHRAPGRACNPLFLTGLVQVAARWLALESLNQLKFSEASDVWASAIASWEIFSMVKYQVVCCSHIFPPCCSTGREALQRHPLSSNHALCEPRRAPSAAGAVSRRLVCSLAQVLGGKT